VYASVYQFLKLYY